MNVTFFSNFMNHHQLFLSEKLVELLGKDNYRFVACTPIDEYRLKMGYEDMNKKASYIIRPYESAEQEKEALRLSECSDVIIFGSGNPQYIINRIINTDKLTLKYSERMFKQNTIRRSLSMIKSKIIYKHSYLKSDNVYYLCASAFVPYDYKICGLDYNRCYKWGYFPETKLYDSIENIINNKKKNSLLWIGRLIDWKHPELAVLTAIRLRSLGYDIELNMIGTGNMESKLKSMINENNLNDCVHLLGSKSPEEVRTYMESSEIFLFTSDRGEGWGAVLNEAMNSGCAVIAGSMIGSAPYLIDNGKNGLVFKDKRLKDLLKKVIYMIDNEAQRKIMAKNAYYTVADTWNADTAAKRLIQLINNINNQKTCFKNGPCSIAEVVDSNWYKKK